MLHVACDDRVGFFYGPQNDRIRYGERTGENGGNNVEVRKIQRKGRKMEVYVRNHSPLNFIMRRLLNMR